MPSVRRAMRMAVTIFEGLSSIKTTSAASMAASEPSAPIATPTSARANAGASFMPSPTKASVRFFFFLSSNCSSMPSLSAGNSCVWQSSMPTRCATSSPTSLRSPVNMTVLLMPMACNPAMASAASSFIRSATTICPAYSPSMDTCTVVPTT